MPDVPAGLKGNEIVTSRKISFGLPKVWQAAKSSLKASSTCDETGPAHPASVSQLLVTFPAFGFKIAGGGKLEGAVVDWQEPEPQCVRAAVAEEALLGLNFNEQLGKGDIMQHSYKHS